MIQFLFKLVHVFGVIIFVGNITVGLFWKRFGDATKDPAIMGHTIAGIIRADKIFTIPAIIVLIIGGFGAAQVEGYPILSTGWILWGLIFFVLAGIAFGPVSRAQRLMLAALARDSAHGGPDYVEYQRNSQRWDVWGTVALVLPILSAAVMILKPALPAF